MPIDAKPPHRHPERLLRDNHLRHGNVVPTQALDRLPVMKKIGPNRPGTKSWQRQHGEQFVCLRYRDDPEQARRYVTIELLVDHRPLKLKASVQPEPLLQQEPISVCVPEPTPTPTLPTDLVQVRIRYTEEALQKKAKEAGARWDRDRRNWVMTRQQAQDAGLQDRIKAKMPSNSPAG